MMLHQPLWLIDLAAYSFQVAAIVIAGSLLPPLLRLRAPRVRLIYWQALLGACLLLPLIEPWRPALSPPYETAGQVSINIGPAVATSAGWPFSLAETLLAVLLAGVLFRTVWILLGLRRLRLYSTRSNALSGPFASIAEARRLTSAGSPVLLSRELRSPATFGLRFPVVLLPELFFQLPPSQQTAIACHELLHIARRDWAWNLVEEFFLTLLWFHPALWWVVRNIRLSREQAVDAEVVRRTQSRQAYLSALLRMAQQDLDRGSVPASLFLLEGQLAQRVALMVKEVSMSRFRLVVTCIVAAAALMLTGGAAVWAFPLRAPVKSPAVVASESGTNDGISGAQSPAGRKLAPPATIPDITWSSGLKLVHVVPVTYPSLARFAHIQSDVVLRVTVGQNGEVSNVSVVSGHPLLVNAALEAVRQWKFAPPRNAPVETLVKLSFRLSAGELVQTNPDNHQIQRVDHASPGKIYKVGEDIQPPVITYSPDPSYTPEALKAKLSGNVVLSIVVSSEGKVVSAKVIKPLGKGLDESAVKTVKTWRFKPGERDGKPVAVKTFVDVTFLLRGQNPPRPGLAR